MEENLSKVDEEQIYETKMIIVNPESFNDSQLEEAVKLLKAGEVVSFPTETVYGLGANAYNSEACKKIFKAKRRPADNPLISHISSMEMLDKLVAYIPPRVKKFLEESQFWPGPLTILFPKSVHVCDEVTTGLDTVGVRMPSHPVARRLIELAGVPIAAPSANSSGRPSPTTASHVYTDLKGRIPCIVDGGDATVGVESTVLDMRTDPPVILRPGGITREQLRKFLPDVVVYGEAGKKDIKLEDKPPTPGLKYTHYSPSARVVLFEFGVVKMEEKLMRRVNESLNLGQKVAIIKTISSNNGFGLPSSFSAIVEIMKTAEHKTKEKEEEEHNKVIEQQQEKEAQLLIYSLGEGYNRTTEEGKIDFAADVAKGLFKALRTLDSRKVDIIFVEGIEDIHAGLAVMNRLRKAASEIVTS